MKKFKVYSSEVIKYETIVECETHNDIYNNLELDEKTDVVDSDGFQIDDYQEITDEEL